MTTRPLLHQVRHVGRRRDSPGRVCRCSKWARSPRRLGTALFVVGLSSPAAAIAQSPARAADRAGADSARAATSDTAPVPRELATALLTGFSPGQQAQPQLVVGRLPAGLPADVVPAGARALGGLAFPEGPPGMPARRGSMAVVVLPRSPAEAPTAVEQHFERAGWRAPERMRDQGGFMPGPVSRPITVCRDSAFISAVVTPRAAGGAYLHVHFAGDAQFTPCRPEAAVRMRPAYDDFPPFPVLHAPLGAQTVGSGGGAGSDAREMSTRLRVALAPAELVTHYGAQLQHAGWKLGPRVGTEGVAIQIASLVQPVQPRDSARVGAAGTEQARTWYGVLTSVALPGSNERDVTFRVMRPVRQVP
jgi:hypothetical protein